MTTFEPARPRYALPFAGKTYELLGTFGLIEAVEYALTEHVGVLAVRLVRGMNSTDLAKLLAAVLTACDHKVTAKEVGDRLWDTVGLTGDANETLRMHLYGFLSMCLAPPGEREQKHRDAGELLGKLAGPAASPGATTGGSASAS